MPEVMPTEVGYARNAAGGMKRALDLGELFACRRVNKKSIHFSKRLYGALAVLRGHLDSLAPDDPCQFWSWERRLHSTGNRLCPNADLTDRLAASPYLKPL